MLEGVSVNNLLKCYLNCHTAGPDGLIFDADDSCYGCLPRPETDAGYQELQEESRLQYYWMWMHCRKHEALSPPSTPPPPSMRSFAAANSTRRARQ